MEDSIYIKARNFRIFPHTKETNFIQRFFARMVCKKILNSEINRFQFGGYEGAYGTDFKLIDAEKESLVHWILHMHGYKCNIAQIKQLLGKSVP